MVGRRRGTIRRCSFVRERIRNNRGVVGLRITCSIRGRGLELNAGTPAKQGGFESLLRGEVVMNKFSVQSLAAHLRNHGERSGTIYTRLKERNDGLHVTLMCQPNEYRITNMRAILAKTPFVVTENSFRGDYEFVVKNERKTEEVGSKRV